MTLYLKLNEKFDAPLSPDYWDTGATENVIVSGGYGRMQTSGPSIVLQPKWYFPDGSPLAFIGPEGVNLGEIELEYKVIPRRRRVAGDSVASQMNSFIDIVASDGSHKPLATAMWSRSGSGTSTKFGFRLYSPSSPAVLYEYTDILVDSPYWVRVYVNKANGAIRLHTSTDGVSWSQRYASIDSYLISDGSVTAYLATQANGSDGYFDVDDFKLSTSKPPLPPRTHHAVKYYDGTKWVIGRVKGSIQSEWKESIVEATLIE